MNTNSNYKIKNVAISTNGRNELYFDVEWEGDNTLDYYELRVLDENKKWVEGVGYASYNQNVVINEFMLGLKSKEINAKTFYVELGIAEYAEDGKERKWNVLANYEPIEVNIYYETHIFRKNVLELR